MWFNSILLMITMFCNLEFAHLQSSQERLFTGTNQNMVLSSDPDTLETEKETYVRVEFKDGSLMTVAPQTKLVFTQSGYFEQAADAQIILLSGMIFFEMQSAGKFDIEVLTEHTIVSINEGQTGIMASGYVWSENGAARVMAMPSGEITRVHSGMYAQISRDGSHILTGRVANNELVHLHDQMKPFSNNIQEMSFVTSLEEKNP